MKRFLFVLLALALSFCALSSARAEAAWLTDYAQAQAAAKASHKLLLLDFTGSDWCGWCRRLEAEVFSQPQFEEYAQKNLVLMKVDFPRAKPLSDEVRKQNMDLARKYQVRGFPTIVVLNGEGQTVGLLGYTPGGPGAFISELKKVPQG